MILTEAININNFNRHWREQGNIGAAAWLMFVDLIVAFQMYVPLIPFFLRGVWLASNEMFDFIRTEKEPYLARYNDAERHEKFMVFKKFKFGFPLNSLIGLAGVVAWCLTFLMMTPYGSTILVISLMASLTAITGIYSLGTFPTRRGLKGYRYVGLSKVFWAVGRALYLIAWNYHIRFLGFILFLIGLPFVASTGILWTLLYLYSFPQINSGMRRFADYCDPLGKKSLIEWIKAKLRYEPTKKESATVRNESTAKEELKSLVAEGDTALKAARRLFMRGTTAVGLVLAFFFVGANKLGAQTPQVNSDVRFFLNSNVIDYIPLARSLNEIIGSRPSNLDVNSFGQTNKEKKPSETSRLQKMILFDRRRYQSA